MNKDRFCSQLSVNDVHSQLNQTTVSTYIKPTSVEEIIVSIKQASLYNKKISICGGRHAMGGQQFAADSILIDMMGMNRVLNFNKNSGFIHVEAGITWPTLIAYLADNQDTGSDRLWAIRQKQTGADNFTLGGSVAANIHGRGLLLQPLSGDIESLQLITAAGNLVVCSRQENAELFSLVIGGYGLFGVIVTVTLRLTQKQTLMRVVNLAHISDVPALFEQKIADGFVYGDFQFSTDKSSPDFLAQGIISCYKPVTGNKLIAYSQQKEHKELSPSDWVHLCTLGHTDPAQAYQVYTNYYLSTSGQLYDSDTHQLSYYPDNYHEHIDNVTKAPVKATEMITELYVPRDKLVLFMYNVANYFRTTSTQLFYGTVRLIQKDTTSFLAWADKPYACIVFNLHVVHTDEQVLQAQQDFQRLIDLALELEGSYYLTYHKWARPDQIVAAYPRFKEFLALKENYDPQELFESEWYRAIKKLL